MNFISKIISTAILLTIPLLSPAQNIQQKNDSIVVLVKNYINTKNIDALYNLTDTELQHYISKKSFSKYLKKDIYPLGEIHASLPFRNETLNSEYKFVLNKDTLLLTLNLDQEYKVRIFILRKYISVTLNKIYPVATSNPLHTNLEKRIDAVIRTYIQKPFNVGLSLGIIYGDKNSIYNYGETIKGTAKLPTENSIFNIGAISQTFTATLLAYFVNKGLIKMDDPITKYLPDSISENTWLKTVSIFSLAKYTSGLVAFPYYPELEKPDRLHTNQGLSDDRFYLYLKHSVPISTPGKIYSYSDIPYNLLSLILEQVSHQSYQNLVETIICKPLNLNNTANHFSKNRHQDLSKFYNFEGKEITSIGYNGLEDSGWLQSNMSDLLKFTAANIQTSEGDNIQDAMQLTHNITYFKNAILGLAWHILKVNNNEYLATRGNSGSNCFLAFDKRKKIAVVILSNSTESVINTGINILKLLD